CGEDGDRRDEHDHAACAADGRRFLEEPGEAPFEELRPAELAVAVVVVGRYRHGGRFPAAVAIPCRAASCMLPRMPLYLTEHEVAGLLTPSEALEAVEESFARLARG